MNRRIRIVLLAAVTAVAALSAAQSSRAEGDYCGPYSYPDLFHTYYVPPVGCTTDPGAVA